MTTKEQERLSSGIIQVASSVRSAPNASASAKALADIVLSETIDAVSASGLNGPREEHEAADAFNRQMDIVLDAGNKSRRLDGRPARRAHMASELDRQRVVVIDTDDLAKLFADSVALDVARQRIDELEGASVTKILKHEMPFDDEGDVSPETIPPVGNPNLND